MRSRLEKVAIMLVFGFGTAIFILKPIFDAVVPRFDIKISVAALPGADEYRRSQPDQGHAPAETSGSEQPSLLRSNVRLVKTVPVGPDGRVGVSRAIVEAKIKDQPRVDR